MLQRNIFDHPQKCVALHSILDFADFLRICKFTARIRDVMDKAGRMLKAPSVNPRVYIYKYFNIDPTEGS